MTHQDEFPAVYSLAGCSPAEPAAASTAATIFDHNRPFANQFPANGNCPRNRLSHFATQASVSPEGRTARCPLFRSGFDKAKHLKRFALVAEQEGVEIHGYCYAK